MFYSVCVFNLQAQWTSQIPQQNDTVWIQDNQIVDENTVWMIGNQFVWDTSINGWNYGNYANYYNTIDGGLNWKSGRFPIDPDRNPYATCITPTDGKKAWSAIYTFSDGSNTVLKTEDGGTNWTQTATDIYTNPSSFINAITFKDGQNGLMFGDPAPQDTSSSDLYFELYTTKDGGNIWTRVPRAQIPDPLEEEYGVAGNYCRSGDHIWFGTNKGRIYSSNDGGENWKADVVGNGYVSAINFWDHVHGLTYAEDTGKTGRILYTEDGGLNWKDVTPPFINVDQYYWTVYLVPISNYFLINISETLEGGPFKSFISKDLGNHWVQFGEGDALSYIKFINPQVGYSGEGLVRNQNHATRIFKYSGNPLTGLLSNNQLDAKLEINPNPVIDRMNLNIVLKEPSALKLILNNSEGKLMWETTITENSLHHTPAVDVRHLAPGTYLLTLSSPEGSLTKKIIKE